MTVTAPEVGKAKAFATGKHRGQKGKRPGQAYIDHVDAWEAHAALERKS